MASVAVRPHEGHRGRDSPRARRERRGARRASVRRGAGDRRDLLLGDFSCTESDPGFRLAPPQPLSLGSWRRQGHPFYDREVAYLFRLPEGSSRGVLSLNDDDWHGSFLIVEQNGRVVARLWEPPYKVPVEGDGPLTLRVVGLPKNLLGPWHDPTRPRGRAWIPMWHGPGIPTSPQPGERYDLLDLGLFRSPRWTPTA